MERMKPATLLLVGLMGLSSLGADVPATQPTDQSTVAAPTDNSQQGRNNRRNRSGGGNGFGGGGNGFGGGGNRGNSAAVSPGMEKYAIVEQRSIFIKGNQSVVIPTAPVKPSQSGTSHNPGIPKNRDEQLLVFNGVIVVDNQANAMVEDQAQLKTYLVQSGDAVSHGKVSAISFDSLTYEANGTSTPVLLGQNLLGQYPIALAAVPPPAPAAPTSQPAGAPVAPGTADSGTPAAGPPAAAAPGGSSPDDILAKLRAKRNQELGIK